MPRPQCPPRAQPGSGARRRRPRACHRAHRAARHRPAERGAASGARTVVGPESPSSAPMLLAKTEYSCRSTVRRPLMANGSIKKIVADRGFGFITGEDGKDYFFHRDGLSESIDFDRLVGGE